MKDDHVFLADIGDAVAFVLISDTRGHRSETVRAPPRPAAALRPLLHRPILTA